MWLRFSFIAAAALGIMAIGLLGGDRIIYDLTAPYAEIAADETTRLGAALSLIKIFGKADTLVLIALLAGACGARRWSLRVFIALILVAAVVLPLKDTVKRMRPDHSERKSFPSGDTATAAALILAAGSSAVGVAGYGLLAAAVAVSRIFFGQHYFSDVVAGGSIGLFAGFAGLRILPWAENLLREKFRRSRWRRLKTLPVLPPRFIFAALFFAALIGEIYMTRAQAHTLHIWQFFAWFAPVIALFFARQFCRHRARDRQPISARKISPAAPRAPRKIGGIILTIALAAFAMLFIAPNNSSFFYRQLSGGALIFVALGAFFYCDLRRKRRLPAAKKFAHFGGVILLGWLLSLALLLAINSEIKRGGAGNLSGILTK